LLDPDLQRLLYEGWTAKLIVNTEKTLTYRSWQFLQIFGGMLSLILTLYYLIWNIIKLDSTGGTAWELRPFGVRFGYDANEVDFTLDHYDTFGRRLHIFLLIVHYVAVLPCLQGFFLIIGNNVSSVVEEHYPFISFVRYLSLLHLASIQFSTMEIFCEIFFTFGFEDRTREHIHMMDVFEIFAQENALWKTLVRVGSICSQCKWATEAAFFVGLCLMGLVYTSKRVVHVERKVRKGE
jgi:hypothetical protein